MKLPLEHESATSKLEIYLLFVLQREIYTELFIPTLLNGGRTSCFGSAKISFLTSDCVYYI